MSSSTTPPTRPTRVALYLRHVTFDRRRETAEAKRLRVYAAQLGLTVTAVVSQTGAPGSGPALLSVLQDFDVVLLSDDNRLTRKPTNARHLLTQLAAHGLRVATLDEDDVTVHSTPV